MIFDGYVLYSSFFSQLSESDNEANNVEGAKDVPSKFSVQKSKDDSTQAPKMSKVSERESNEVESVSVKVSMIFKINCIGCSVLYFVFVSVNSCSKAIRKILILMTKPDHLR